MVYRSTSRQDSQVYAIAALNASKAWAVGARAGSDGREDHPLALRWNGQAWRSVTVPGVAGSYLTDVAASGRSGLWIFAVPGNGGSAKAVRWDGTRWQDIPLPADVFPNDVVVLKPADAWVVGPQQPCTGSGTSKVCPTTLYHWNGGMWTPFTVPVVVDELSGAALSASGPDHVWVAGASRPCGASRCSYRVEVYRWNGATWGKAPGFPRVYSSYLPGLAMTSGRNVWVGTWSTTKPGHPGRLLHWNGTSWHTISAPGILTTETPLVTDGRSGVWMGPWAHWTGTRWLDTAAGRRPPVSLARLPASPAGPPSGEAEPSRGARPAIRSTASSAPIPVPPRARYAIERPPAGARAGWPRRPSVQGGG